MVGSGDDGSSQVRDPQRGQYRNEVGAAVVPRRPLWRKEQWAGHLLALYAASELAAVAGRGIANARNCIEEV